MNCRHALGFALCLLLTACGTSADVSQATSAPLLGAMRSAVTPPPLIVPAMASPLPEQRLNSTLSPSALATSRPTLTPSPTFTPVPTATLPPARSAPVRLQIAAIDLDRPLVAVGLDAQRVPIVPNHDVAWYNLSARPGEGENIVLWGHVLRFMSALDIPAPFAHIHDLVVGDDVLLADAAGQTWRYRVARQVWATPDQVAYILPQGREMLTMVSCIGDKVVVDSEIEMSHRLITIAEPVE